MGADPSASTRGSWSQSVFIEQGNSLPDLPTCSRHTGPVTVSAGARLQGEGRVHGDTHGVLLDLSVSF
jgi:hypothetical protein